MRLSRRVPTLPRLVAAGGLVVCVTLAPSPSGSAEPLEASTLLEVVLVPSTQREGAAVKVTRVDSAAETPDTRSGRWRSDVLSWSVPRGSRWRVEATRTGLWAEPIVVTADDARVRVPLLTHPTGRVTGRVKVAGGEEVPDRIGLRFQTAGRKRQTSSKTLEGTVECPIRESRFECEVPAGIFDVRLRAPTFISQYSWDVQVEAGDERSFGGVTLRPGASVAGWVEAAPGRLDPGRCRIELEPLRSRGNEAPTPDEAERWTRLAHSVHPDERGFFHLEGVAPGQYALVASQPGFAAARRAPIPVSERTETILAEPVVLQPPEDLEVFVDPATDPAGDAWSLRLDRIDAFSRTPERVAVVEVPPDGWWRWEGLALGEYVLTVRDRAGATYVTHQVHLEPPTGAVQLEIPVVGVRGQVLLGREPLAADLGFVHPVRGSKLRLTTDDDGRFEGALPFEGEWDVLVLSRELGIKETLSGVEVRASEASGRASLELRLPSTRLRGEVVDELGVGTPASLVVMTLGERPMGRRTDQDGSFEMVGLPEGQVQIVAEAEDGRRSEYHLVELVEDLEPAPVRLVVRRRVRLAGEVLSPEGPVPGARLDIVPATAPTGFFETVVTDVRGGFEVELPSGTSEVAGVLEAPGFALQAFRLSIDPRSPVTLRAERAAGALRIELPAPLVPPSRRSRELVVLQDGRNLPMPSLRRWSAFHGERPDEPAVLTVPRVAPGRYAACLVPVERLMEALVGVPTDGRDCAEGYLAPGGQLLLEVPEPAGS